MKLNVILFAIIITLSGCANNENATPVITKTDSLIMLSDSITAKVKTTSKHLDSITTATLNDAVIKYDVLNSTIDDYKSQTEELKTTLQIQRNVEKIVRDTIYIETKKNFWGKTKKTMTVVKDETPLEKISFDTINGSVIMADTIKNN